MGILHFWSDEETDEDMARAKRRQVDAAKIDLWVSQLKKALKDADAFKAVYGAMDADGELSSAEIVEIAHKFTGSRTKTRKAALGSIGQERLRVAHAKAKGESAAKTRTW